MLEIVKSFFAIVHDFEVWRDAIASQRLLHQPHVIGVVFHKQNVQSACGIHD
jgi:hypothetical protein